MSSLEQWLIKKFDIPGPRYTSYPTALNFTPEINESDFITATQLTPEHSLSLYLHIPFCHTLCYYCACNKAITRDPARIERYLGLLKQEIIQRAPLFKNRLVKQLHFGGGTPSYLTNQQLKQLIDLLNKHYQIAPTIELSLEIDPRQFAVSRLAFLADLGFNRLSFGIQDFTLTVQQAINRIQPFILIKPLIDEAQRLSFNSINFDLIYGLPYQQLSTFDDTIAQVISLMPDRISLFGYAHLSERFPAQRLIELSSLPDAKLRLELLTNASTALIKAGYIHIGMDHFALPTNELAIAQRHNVLHRNFQGYTTHGNSDLLAFGVSAISQIGNLISQNNKLLRHYQNLIAQRQTPIWGGVKLSEDDRLRARIINQLICNFYLNITEFEQQQADTLSQKFNHYFNAARHDLMPLIDAEMMDWNEQYIQVHKAGRVLIRRICMAFDRYYQQHQTRYSRIL